MSRVVSEFEGVCSTGPNASDKFHHEYTTAFEKRLRTPAKNFLNIMNEEEHPLECRQLLAIGSQNLIAPKESIIDVRKANSDGLNR